ncbi:MAG: metallophosphoesterase [Flavobacteriaceae bacterium]
MRTLVIGDIHAGLRALVQVMERARVGEEDKLIFVGDYVDGWSEAVETVNFLIELNSTHKCCFLRGNHDELCEAWLRSEKSNPLWVNSGGQSSIDSYNRSSREIRKIHLDFFGRLENYYLDDQQRLFLHAGFTHIHGVAAEYYTKPFYWDRTLWELALALDPRIALTDVRYPKRLSHYHEIYIGHTPVTRIGKTIPHRAANVWNIDTGAAFTGPLSIIDIESKKVWQSDPVYTLYPGEKGRN